VARGRFACPSLLSPGASNVSIMSQSVCTTCQTNQCKFAQLATSRIIRATLPQVVVRFIVVHFVIQNHTSKRSAGGLVDFVDNLVRPFLFIFGVRRLSNLPLPISFNFFQPTEPTSTISGLSWCTLECAYESDRQTVEQSERPDLERSSSFERSSVLASPTTPERSQP
jgi:hypothetical protein